jgi:hypothetical protein
VQHKKTTWIDKTEPGQHKKDNHPGCLFYVALLLFYLSRLSFLFCTGTVLSIQVAFLCCTGAVLSIQVVFVMLHWCCFVYPGCLFYKTAPVQHKKTTWIDKTAPVQHEKDNLNRQNSTSAA